jgi:hypothetical protein
MPARPVTPITFGAAKGPWRAPSETASARSPRGRVLVGMSRISLVVLALSILWTWWSAGHPSGLVSLPRGGGDFELRLLILGVGLVTLMLSERRQRLALQRSLISARECWRESAWCQRAAIALLVVMACRSLDGYIAAPKKGLLLKHRVATSAHPGLFHNDANRHVPDLLEFVVSRASTSPVVVHIDDEDPRGHMASFYCYPRLLMMEPGFRRWTVRWRQFNLDVDVVESGPGSIPSTGASRSFAAALGLPWAEVVGDTGLWNHEAGGP